MVARDERVHHSAVAAEEMHAGSQSRRGLATLGRLSAGMAHELNNPPAAARRGAALLERAIADLQRVQLDLGALSLSELSARAPVRLEPLALSDREEKRVPRLTLRVSAPQEICMRRAAEKPRAPLAHGGIRRAVRSRSWRPADCQ
jgi:signal transduction histidine kinase